MHRWWLPPILLATLACAGGGLPLAPERAPRAARLRPPTDLTTGCHGWPERPWSRRNRAGPPRALLQRGDPAVDFVLRDLQGAEHRLGDLLGTGPVLLLQGSYTCPRFQGAAAGIAELASDYAGALHTVLVYTLEAHPRGQPTPYHGVPREYGFSDRPQPTDHATRAHHARDVELGPDVLLLVDGLDAEGANPVWCTYGRCPSCAWLIDRDGVVDTVQLWTDPPALRRSIDALLARGG